MSQIMTPSSQPNHSIGRFGLLLAAAVILYVAAIMVFIVVY
jgi:hypothetical protein